MNSTQNLLSVVHLKKYFPMQKPSLFSSQRQYLRANDDVSLEIKKGETFSLVGESGCGKSTFGRTLLQLQRPTEGEVWYDDGEKRVDLAKLTDKQLRAYRKDLQIIFQDPYSSLNPRMTVGRIIGEGAAAHRFFKDKNTLREYVLQIMQDCGLPPQFYNRYPHEFSGGQRQRVCIARALALKPKFIVCDECVSALDVSIQSQILNLLQDLKEKQGLTYLFISHDLSVVRHISDKIAVMYLGEIVELGDSERVFKQPLHPYTIALMSAAPRVGKGKAKEKIILEGQIPSAVCPPKGCKFHTRCFMAREECRRGKIPLTETEDGHFVRCLFAGKSTKDKTEIALGGEKTDKNL